MDICLCGAQKDKRSKSCKACHINKVKAKDNKHCNGCNKDLPLNAFGMRGNTNKPRSRCRECETKATNDNRIANLERVREWKRKAYRSMDSDKKLRMSIRSSARKLGLDPDFVEREFNEHMGLCTICLRHPMDIGTHYNRLVIDHNHATGEYRGLLCGECNIMLGKARDDISTLERGIQYLKGELDGKPNV